MGSAEDQYELLRPIGAGSFGQVFLVLHRQEQRYYVMKELANAATMDESQRESTQLEVDLLSQLCHPNIVGYRDSFINDQGNLAIYMEYCEHGELYLYLQELKKTAGKMPSAPKVLEWFVQIVFALHALHVRKILHRDLKMQNIFLTGSKEKHAFALKLGDFGVSKVLNSTTDLAMTQIGTPFYMSPETFNNKPYGFKSDVWGLGCVLYEVVNGQRPFDAQSINGLAMKVVQGRYTPITASCAEETKCLIKAMLNNNPAHRPTLQEALHVPSVRRRVKPAMQMVTAVAPSDAKPQTEATLTDQLISLGLGSLVNCPVATVPSRDRRQSLQRLERAERRKKKEEDTLRRLQETAGLLASCLVDASPRSHARNELSPRSHLSHMVARQPERDDGSSEEIEAVPRSSSFYDHGPRPARSGPNSARGEAPMEQTQDGFNAEEPPMMSHRDRILQRKERRREEEQQKFEEEARKIREENLAYQRAWVQESNRSRVPTKQSVHPSTISSGSQPPHVLPQLALGSNNSQKKLHGYEHAKPANLPRPHDSSHHTPRQQRQRFASEPKPPMNSRPQFGHHHAEPPPPQEAPHRSAGRWSHSHWSSGRERGGTGGQPMHPSGTGGQPMQTSRSMHSIHLDTLGSDGFDLKLPEHSDGDSGPEGSANYSDDGLSELGRKTWGQNASDEQVRRHSLVVQQRIDACRAAIYRHKMTIETLQYTCAQSGDKDGPDDSEAAPQHFIGQEPGDTRRRSGGTPAIVLDRITRLKRRCHEGLGSELFHATRHCLQTLLDAGEVAEAVRSEMLDKLGLEKIGFYSLIDQIVYMECRWGHCEDTSPQKRQPQELA